MNKEAAYPWIFAITGGLIGLIILITTTLNYNFFILNTIVFGITFGCIYGWVIEQSKRAIIIGGFVGGLLGLHPMPFFSFVFGGAYVATWYYSGGGHSIAESPEPWKYFLFCEITSVMMWLFMMCIGAFADWEEVVGFFVFLIIVGIIPGINMFISFGIGAGFAEACGYELGIMAPPFFVIPLLAFIGYGIGKIAEKRVKEKKKLGDYKSKIEQWKREGYDVSELEEMLK